MGAPGGASGGDLERGVAIEARALAVARHAEARLCARFEGMTCAKAGAMQTGELHAVEGEAPRQSRYHADAVTACAVAFAVTRSAEIARAGRAQTVLASPIAIVHEVTGRQGLLGRQIHVATIAVTGPPLVFVLVTPEADRHLGSQRFRPFQSDFDMAAHTVALRRGHVGPVFESQVPARELGTPAHVRFAVTVFASTLVVGLRVAFHTVRHARKVHGVRFSCGGDPFVAGEATDPLENMGTVFEGVRRLSSNAENAGTRADAERESEHDRKPLAHGISSVRARRTRPFHSKR
jgi:hypothetical protein